MVVDLLILKKQEPEFLSGFLLFLFYKCLGRIFFATSRLVVATLLVKQLNKIMTTGILRVLFVLAMLFLAAEIQAQNSSPINPKDITIVRDQWGIPHIYGKTDADAAYGLVWAQCEDDFDNIQMVYAGLAGRAGESWGKEGAGYDVVIFAANLDPIIEEQFDTAFSPEFYKILSASAQAVNDYAAMHPEELRLKKIFPIDEKQIVKAYLFGGLVMSNAIFEYAKVLKNKMQVEKIAATGGSNAFVFQKHKTGENTLMVSNSHQPLEGPFAWYEAHVVSEEGWNMMGAKFTTGVSLFVGTNENLGWTHTVNYPDLCDVYQLKMHPKKKNHYYFDGEWLPLEVRKLKFKVKVGPIKIPIKKTFYVSKYGPTLKNKSGYFSMRSPAMMRINAPEQWFHMNKAKNLKEFKEAYEIQGIGSLNVLYADKEDNVFMISNGLFPKERGDEYEWESVLKGEGAGNLWSDDFYDIDELPTYENPECGYLFNMNNTPFSATEDAENFDKNDAPPHAGYLVEETNRALRFQELMESHTGELAYEEFKKLKFDVQYNSKTFFTRGLKNLDDLFTLDESKYPDLEDAFKILHAWDRRSDVKNRNAALMSMTLVFVLKILEEEMNIAGSMVLTEEEIVESLRSAKKHLLKHFGRMDIEAGELHKHIRGDVEIPVAGMPENLAAMTYRQHKKGKLKTFHGESFIQLVQYDENGVVRIESITPFGSSNREDSQHFTDQMQMYVDREFKEMSLDRKVILENAVRSYHPGEIDYKEVTRK